MTRNPKNPLASCVILKPHQVKELREILADRKHDLQLEDDRADGRRDYVPSAGAWDALSQDAGMFLAILEDCLDGNASEVLTEYESEDPDYDPSPWCSGCGAKTQAGCNCGPIARNA